MKTYSLQFLVATTCFKIIFEDKEMFSVFREATPRLRVFSKSSEFTFVVKKCKGEASQFEKVTRKVFNLNIPEKFFSYNYCSLTVRVLISVLLMQRNVFLFHASSLTYHDGAYLFCGPSGSGKSTVVSKIPLVNRLGDDTAIVAKHGNSFYCYMSPFDGIKMPGLKYKKSRLKGVFVLQQSRENIAVRLTHQSAYKYLIKNSYFYIYTFPREAFYSKEECIKGGISVKIQKYQQMAFPMNILKALFIKVANISLSVPVSKLKFTKDYVFTEIS